VGGKIQQRLKNGARNAADTFLATSPGLSISRLANFLARKQLEPNGDAHLAPISMLQAPPAVIINEPATAHLTAPVG
jgi:hypothetical protein